MRAKEFTINVPITITISGDEDPVVSTSDKEDPDPQQNPVMITPLQQELELSKATQGKKSPVIDKLVSDNDIGKEPSDDSSSDYQAILDRIRSLISY